MPEPYVRAHPEFSLCGLCCALCPRHHTGGSSRCPGCGGPDFRELHPSCSVISCAKRHGGVEFCFECAEYPCERYARIGEKDSFMSYRNVLSDMARASGNLDLHLEIVQRKGRLLRQLIASYDNGRNKAFYCTAVNVLDIEVAERAVARAIEASGAGGAAPEKAADLPAEIRTALESAGAAAGLELRLRK